MPATLNIETLKGLIRWEQLTVASMGIPSLPFFHSHSVGTDAFAPVAAATVFVYDSFLLLSMEVSSLIFGWRKLTTAEIVVSGSGEHVPVSNVS